MPTSLADVDLPEVEDTVEGTFIEFAGLVKAVVLDKLENSNSDEKVDVHLVMLTLALKWLNDCGFYTEEIDDFANHINETRLSRKNRL